MNDTKTEMAEETLNDTQSDTVMKYNKKIEELQQKIYQLTGTLATEKLMNVEMENDIQRLQLEVKESKYTLENKTSDLKREWTDKLQLVKENLDEERENSKNVISQLQARLEEFELKEKLTKLPGQNYREDLETAAHHISSLMAENSDLKEQLSETKSSLEKVNEENHRYLAKIKELEMNLEENKDLMKQNADRLASAIEALQEAQGEKALLANELSALKVGPIGELHRGNSLFSEVEDKRQVLANKYTQAKKKLVIVQAERDKLKDENLRLLRCSQEEENSKIMQYGQLLQSYRKSIEELTQLMRTLEKRPESPQVITISENDLSQLNWIDTIIDNARAESRKLRKELEERSAQRLIESNQLYAVQQELRNLKSQERRSKAQIEDLSKELDEYKKKLSEIQEENKSLKKENTETQTKAIRFADDVKTDDSSTRKKEFKRLPKPQSYPKIVINAESVKPLQQRQLFNTEGN